MFAFSLVSLKFQENLVIDVTLTKTLKKCILRMMWKELDNNSPFSNKENSLPSLLILTHILVTVTPVYLQSQINEKDVSTESLSKTQKQS